MTPFYPRICRRLVSLCVFCTLFMAESSAQLQNPTLTAKNISMFWTSLGFYESLPSEYNAPENDEASYPLLIILHGQGQMGSGSDELPLVLTWGAPQLIRDGRFPRSFSSGGQQFSFITIIPQYWINASGPEFVNAVIDYCVAHYRVRQNRIYITAASVGGGMLWNAVGSYDGLASRVAAIVPMAGRMNANNNLARNIAEANLPVWAFHNEYDPTVNSQWTVNWINTINNQNPTPVPAAKATIFPEYGHDCWTQASDPNYREQDKNMYEWMLTYTRGQDPLPVRLSSYTAQAIFTGSSPRIRISWTTAFEENNASFTVERSADGRNFTPLTTVAATNLAQGSAYQVEDVQPLSGTGYYRLLQRDIDGTVTYFNIKTVYLGQTGKVSIYPNPVSNTLNVSLNNDYNGSLRFRIINSTGTQLFTKTYVKTGVLLQDQLTVSSLAPGYYVLEIVGEGYRSQTSFVKK